MEHSQRRNGAIVQGVFDSPQLPCHYLTVAMGLDIKVKIEEYTFLYIISFLKEKVF